MTRVGWTSLPPPQVEGKRETNQKKTNEKGPTTQLAINTPTPNNKLDEFGGEQMVKFANTQTNEIRDELPDEPQIGENGEDNQSTPNECANK